MNAHVSDDGLRMMMPTTASHFSPVTAKASAPAPRGLLDRIGGVVRWLAEMPRRRALLDELNMLSDHELADIGLSRCDLGRVFEPGFVAERSYARAIPGRTGNA